MNRNLLQEKKKSISITCEAKKGNYVKDKKRRFVIGKSCETNWWCLAPNPNIIYKKKNTREKSQKTSNQNLRNFSKPRFTLFLNIIHSCWIILRRYAMNLGDLAFTETWEKISFLFLVIFFLQVLHPNHQRISRAGFLPSGWENTDAHVR